MTDDDDEPEDKLLEAPTPGAGVDLSRLWAIRSNLVHQRELDELNRELSGNAPPRMLMPWTDPHTKQLVAEKRRRDQRAYEQAMLQISERQDHLLQLIEQDQARVEERRKEIEDNALRLHDGRRVYVDGDRFRDEQGRVLSGADEAEASRQHEYRPDAPTYQQKQEIDRQAQKLNTLKEKILRDRERGQGTPEEASQRLSGYEKEYRDKVEARTEQAPVEFGSADYMQAYGLSSVPAFTAAAAPVSRETIGKPADDNAGTQTAELKQPAGEKKSPPGQAPPKFQV